MPACTGDEHGGETQVETCKLTFRSHLYELDTCETCLEWQEYPVAASHLLFQVLDMLQSSSVPAQSVEVTILSELQPLAAQQDSKGAAAGLASSPLPSARAATPQPAAKGNSQSGHKVAAKGGRTPSAAGGKAPHGSAAASNAAAAAAAALAAGGGVGGPAAAEAPVVPLEKHITSIIGASKQEVEVAAKAYYAAKVGEPGADAFINLSVSCALFWARLSWMPMCSPLS